MGYGAPRMGRARLVQALEQAVDWYHERLLSAPDAALARKYLPEFGLAAYCGFGRSPVAELPGILADHVKAAESAA